MLARRFLFRDLFNCVRIIINNVFEQNVIYDIRRDVFKHSQRLPIGYFDQRASGDLMTRVIDEVNADGESSDRWDRARHGCALSVIGVMALLLHKNPLLALIALAADPAAHRRNVLVHVDRAQALSAAKESRQRDERVPDGQSARHAPNQGFWTAEPRGRAFCATSR